jgi:hypothetical protein
MKRRVIIPSPKPANTKPYINWLRTCGINNVATEDDVMAVWEKYLNKAFAYNKNTDISKLVKFKRFYCIKQMDIDIDEKRSSDIVMSYINRIGRKLVRHTGQITISEHSVRRYWEHTQTKPDIMDWFNRFPNYEYDLTEEHLYCPQGLLVGNFNYSSKHYDLYDINTRTDEQHPEIGFRIKTIIPAECLNERQAYLWYQLKQRTEKAHNNA